MPCYETFDGNAAVKDRTRFFIKHLLLWKIIIMLPSFH